MSLYSNARHGSSLTTLLARCAGWQPTLVVVETCAPSPCVDGTTSATVEQDVIEGGNKVVVAAAAGGVSSGDAVDTMQIASQRREGSTAAATAGAVTFGGFASGSPWKNMGRAFAGDGGSFVFTFGPDGSSNSAGERPPFSDQGFLGGVGSAGSMAGLRVYPWSRKDRCFMTSSEGVGLGMGGGGDGGSFGFLLSEDLRSGSTGRCETFQNPPLVQAADPSGRVGGSVGVVGGSGTVFDVLSVEVWGFRAAKAPEALTRIAL